jgi:two-component system, chemotaxis family, chemotaxis protein CheY
MKILIVDDSRAMRAIIRRAIHQMGLKDCTVLEASNGQEGLKSINESQPDLVMCDYNMPEMNGLEFLQTLRRYGLNTRFGFITSDATATLRSEAQAAGALFILTKPFTPASFSETLSPVINGLVSKLGDAAEAPAVGSAKGGEGSFRLPQVAQLLKSMLRPDVRVVAAPPMKLPPDATHFIAEYTIDHASVVACVISDLSFAARVGAALTLLPASAANEALSAHQLTAILWENFQEVLNVASRLFDSSSGGQVTLKKLYHQDEKPGPELLAALAKPALRLDASVTVDNYGEGKLTIAKIAS